MNTAVLQHPAVAIATSVAHRLDGAAAAVAVLARDEIAAVLLESPDHRLVVFIPHEDGSWVAPGMSSGSRRPADAPQEPRTGDVPLTGVTGRGFCGVDPAGAPLKYGWFAVTGRAAADALEISLTSSIETVTEPISKDGLSFALVRTPMVDGQPGDIPTFEKPEIRIRTQDGRSISMLP